MKEQLIEVDTAKLANEKGFDWDGYVVVIKHHEGKDYYLPTQSLLQKWIREVHKIDIRIEPPVLEIDEPTYTGQIFTRRYSAQWESGPKETYEQALESTLIEALHRINK